MINRRIRGYLIYGAIALVAFWIYSQSKDRKSKNAYVNFTENMRTIHVVIRRGIEQSELYAEKVEGKEIQNFLGYVSSLLENLNIHHLQEEEIIFPALQQQFETETKQMVGDHKRLQPALEDLKFYCENSSKNHNQWDSKVFLQKMKELKSIVLPHLSSEERFLEADKLSKSYKEEFIRDLGKRIGKHAQNTLKKSTEFAFILSHLNAEEKMVMFGSVPFLVRNLIFPFYELPNRDYWKYSKRND